MNEALTILREESKNASDEKKWKEIHSLMAQSLSNLCKLVLSATMEKLSTESCIQTVRDFLHQLPLNQRENLLRRVQQLILHNNDKTNNWMAYDKYLLWRVVFIPESRNMPLKLTTKYNLWGKLAVNYFYLCPQIIEARRLEINFTFRSFWQEVNRPYLRGQLTKMLEGMIMLTELKVKSEWDDELLALVGELLSKLEVIEIDAPQVTGEGFKQFAKLQKDNENLRRISLIRWNEEKFDFDGLSSIWTEGLKVKRLKCHIGHFNATNPVHLEFDETCELSHLEISWKNFRPSEDSRVFLQRLSRNCFPKLQTVYYEDYSSSDFDAFDWGKVTFCSFSVEQQSMMKFDHLISLELSDWYSNFFVRSNMCFNNLTSFKVNSTSRSVGKFGEVLTLLRNVPNLIHLHLTVDSFAKEDSHDSLRHFFNDRGSLPNLETFFIATKLRISLTGESATLLMYYCPRIKVIGDLNCWKCDPDHIEMLPSFAISEIKWTKLRKSQIKELIYFNNIHKKLQETPETQTYDFLL